MDRNTLFTSIKRLRTRKEQLLREVEEVSLEIDIQNTKYSQFLNDDAPVYRLPDEILTHIFFLVQRNFTTHHPDGSGIVPLLHVNASHVSHRWRSIVLATPLLWNIISFHIRPAKSAFERVLSLFDAHLLRSAQCFLDIDLHFYDTQVDLAPYLSRLAVHASRWRRLSIAMNIPEPHMDALKELFCTVDAQTLEHLSLSLGDHLERDIVGVWSPYPSLDGTILAPSAPALSFVRLAGHAIGLMHPPLHSITTLHLDGWTRHFIKPDQLTCVLASVPHIVNLSLNQLFMAQTWSEPPVTTQAIALPHLRQLRLCGAAEGQLLYPASFCMLIDAQGLNGLTLGFTFSLGGGPFDFAPLPSVQHITLDGRRFGAADVARLARATPNVVSLTAETTLSEILKGLLPGDGPGAAAARPWPALRTLELWDMEVGDVPHLCHLVFTLQGIGALSKAGGGGGLSKVSLDRGGRTAMRTKHRLDWLEERVDVWRSGEREHWPLGLGYPDPHYLVL